MFRSISLAILLSTVFVGSCVVEANASRGLKPEEIPFSLAKTEDNDDVKELYITQRLDHFDRTNEATYQQRYFVSYRHHITINGHKKKTPDAQAELPIISLLCVGGEGPGFDNSVLIDSVHCSGDMLELAKRIAQTKTHHVHLYALEHRYYGKSYPRFVDPKSGNETSPLAVENLRYHSSRQALEDLAHFVHTMNQQTSTDDGNGSSSNTWITFGGSYPGSMALYARYKYPHLIFASVSSSAPLQLKVDFPGYHARAGWDLKYEKIGGSDECHRIVKTGHNQAVALLQQGSSGNKTDDDGPVVLAKKFKVCNPGTALAERRNQEALLGDGLISIMAQGNDPSCTGDLCNIAGLCQFMIQEFDKTKSSAGIRGGGDGNMEMEVLAKVSDRQKFGKRREDNMRSFSIHDQMMTRAKPLKASGLLRELNDDDDCQSSNFDDIVEYYSSLDIESFGGRSWLWQTCTEFGFYQTCEDDCPYASHFHSVDSDLEICSRVFNISSDEVYENVQSSLDHYGGKAFLRPGAASKILVVNGNVDPWSVLGLEENDSTDYLLPVKVVDGASHHFWTHAVKDTDALEILQIREYIYSCVMNWLGLAPYHIDAEDQRDETTSVFEQRSGLWVPSVASRRG